jgi:hypothetical protein
MGKESIFGDKEELVEKSEEIQLMEMKEFHDERDGG